MRPLMQFLLPALAAALALFGLFYAPRLNRFILFIILLVAGGLVIASLVYMASDQWYPYLRF